MLSYGVKPYFFCRGGSQKGGGGLPKQLNIKTTAKSKRQNRREQIRVRVIYQAPRSRVRVDTAGEDEAEPQARPSTSWPDPPVHGDEGPDINRVVWSEMNATASGLYGS